MKASRASWVQMTYITDDTEILAAEANEALTGAATELAKQATQYDHLQLPAELARKMLLLKLSAAIPAPAPSDPKELAEMSRIATSLEADYGKGKYCPSSGKHAGESLDITQIEKIMATSTDPDELQDVWIGWHRIAPPMRERYARWVELGNKGAREMGFSDLSAMWREGYDMTPDEFSAEVERLWQQVKPLYESLHAYVRGKLVEKYGSIAVDAGGRIRADLLGNPWAQEWGNIFSLVAPAQQKQPYDVTDLLKANNVDAVGMVKYGEQFFTSLGFAPLPKSFWERSLFVRPRDREVVCHASAWDVDNFEDLRLKMCIQIDGEDFVTVHHELGHTMYQRAYQHLPYLFKNGANDGFHEAIGDAIALAITPEYLQQVGLLETVPQTDDTGYLLRMAMDKIAFLPFGLLIDQWRWKVFNGEIQAGRLQPVVVGDAREVSGRVCAGGAQRSRLRPGREVSCAVECALHAVFPGPRSAISVLSQHGARSRMYGTAASLVVLRQQGRGSKAECHAGDGTEPAVARRAVHFDRRAPDGCECDDGILCSAEAVAG